MHAAIEPCVSIFMPAGAVYRKRVQPTNAAFQQQSSIQCSANSAASLHTALEAPVKVPDQGTNGC